MFPVRPNQVNAFAGTMGEIRGTHFHGGLDIKTSGIEGLPIYAAADGYLNRVRVSPYGYGHVMYLQHENGQVTVYAHLQRFTKVVADYVLEQQYQRNSFSVDLYPGKGTFMFKKGDIIGYSGNTGSSGGPHLHFEIRDMEQRPMNPVKFGFKEIKDTTPPTIQRLSIVPMNIEARVEGQYETSDFSVTRNGKAYQLVRSPEVFGKVAFEIQTYDKADNNRFNKFGINRIEVWLDGKIQYKHVIDRVPFHMNTFVDTFVNFERYRKDRDRYQRLYRTEANQLPIYPEEHLTGILDIKDGGEHQVVLKLWDSFDNMRELSFGLKGTAGNHVLSLDKVAPVTVGCERYANTLKVVLPAKMGEAANVLISDYKIKLSPAYRVGDKNIYLWALKYGIPDLFWVENEKVIPQVNLQVEKDKPVLFQENDITVKFEPNAVFQKEYIRVLQKGDTLWVGNTTIPLRRKFTAAFKPATKSLQQKEKSAVYQLSAKGDRFYVGGTWNGDYIEFTSGGFGTFTIAEDTVPPVINVLEVSSSRLKFKVKDEDSGVKSTTCTLNGEFLLMHYDPKKDLIYSLKKDQTKPLKGVFRMEVKDQLDNVTVFERKL
ncbi:M23 family metallopeptidase [Algivirga pacifica]|uniref:M23 family metallopeptidase n=2 Tax=Algivirga pacifica TaxID=1162670 RepID=A0ABP9DE48_9BACT